jgi:small subunit ribosomal protein S13
MARIAGVTIPPEKRVEIALTYIHGVGRSLSSRILSEVGIDTNKRVKDLSDSEINELRRSIEKNYKVEGELRRGVMLNIKRFKEISCYRGTRHAKNLPARGQKTRTNSRTVRGNVRKTAGSGRRPPTQKT